MSLQFTITNGSKNLWYAYMKVDATDTKVTYAMTSTMPSNDTLSDIAIALSAESDAPEYNTIDAMMAALR